MKMISLIRGFLFGLTSLLLAGSGFAQETMQGVARIGKPSQGAMGFQTASTEIARDNQWLDGLVLSVIGVITVFVVFMLIWVIIRYNSKRNKVPARFTHHSMVEIVWTMVPIVILIVIGSFSLPILFKQIETPESDITIKITGNQWYWTYEYPKSGVVFDSFMIGQGEPGLTEGVKAELAKYGYTPDEYLLAVDNPLVVPVGATVRALVTGSDVNHSFAVPSFGIKMDGIVGRLNETWFRIGADPRDVAAGKDSNANYIGLYFGQCSELCGVNHSYMPIVVKAVSPEDYTKWLAKAAQKYSSIPAATRVASN